MYDFEDDRRWPHRIAVLALVAATAAGVFVFVRGGADRPPPGLGARVQAAAPVTAPTTTPTEPPSEPPLEEPAETTIEPLPKIIAGRVVAAVEARIAPEAAPTTDVMTTDVMTTTPTTTPPTPASTPTSTTAPTPTTTAVAGAGAIGELGYPAASDGSPLPIVATYDVGSITLAGHVPSEAARERLIALARANSQDGTDIEVRDRMITNERVPIDVGVRVIESNSPRFGEGAAEITVEHAAQLDRVGAIMHALPHVTALVVGHADQRGDEATNLALSNERAVAVVDYLVYLGVAPTRLASKAAGEEHLLTLDDDEAALALNRRTEFVFYGILAD